MIGLVANIFDVGREVVHCFRDDPIVGQVPNRRCETQVVWRGVSVKAALVRKNHVQQEFSTKHCGSVESTRGETSPLFLPQLSLLLRCDLRCRKVQLAWHYYQSVAHAAFSTIYAIEPSVLYGSGFELVASSAPSYDEQH